MTSWTIIEAPEEEAKSGVLGRRLRHFNYEFVGEYPEQKSVCLSARDKDDRMIGGLRGFLFLHWLNIDVLWVDEAARATGIGSALLEQAETKARSLGAHSAMLNTFEWQAPAFYVKRGYKEFGRIDDHTDGFYLAFMKKRL